MKKKTSKNDKEIRKDLVEKIKINLKKIDIKSRLKFDHILLILAMLLSSYLLYLALILIHPPFEKMSFPLLNIPILLFSIFVISLFIPKGETSRFNIFGSILITCTDTLCTSVAILIVFKFYIFKFIILAILLQIVSYILLVDISTIEINRMLKEKLQQLKNSTQN